MAIFYRNQEYYLNSFLGVATLAQDDKNNFISEMQKRIKRIVDGIYFDPDALCLMEEHIPYSLNIGEFCHHVLPFVNKIFVVFLTNLITGHQKLLYAKNICLPNQPTWMKFMTDREELTSSLADIFRQVPSKLLKNLVAIVSDRNRLNLRTLEEVGYRMGYHMPPLLYDATHLIAEFCYEIDAFCEDTINCILSAKFTRETFRTELSEIRARCRSGNYATLEPMWYFCRETERVLNRIFNFNIINSSFSAQFLRNNQLEEYGRGATSQMPVLDRDQCEEAGIVYFLTYEVAMQLNHL